MDKANKARAIKIAIILLPLIAFILSLFIGRYELGFTQVLKMIVSPGANTGEISYSILYDLRIPRAILGLLVGGILAASGASLQGMFKNPLVDSGMLGVSSGAGFGAIVGIILFGNSQLLTIVSAFGFGLIAVLLAYMIGTVYKSSPKLMLVLGGVIVSALFSSLISMGKFVADPMDQLPSIVFWLMGSLANVSYAQVLYVLVPVLVSAVGLSILGWKINVLSMGDRDAQALGVNTKVVKALVVAFSALGTAAAVSVVGTIGWIGLVIPHIVRMMLGSNNRVIIPYSFLLGAGFLALIDILARTMTSAELPIGMLTSFIGLPFYVFLLRKTRGGGW